MPEPLRTLLVEDNADDARTLRRLLAEGAPSIFVDHVERLSDAIAYLKEQRPDVVLLDLSLPDVQGVASVRRLHEEASHLPIVVLIADEDDATALAAVHEGAQDAIVKSQAQASLLSRALRYAVERKRAEENGRRLLLERARRVQAEAAERRASFLAEAGSQLASVLDKDEMPHHVAKVAVPFLADCCLVDVVAESGDLERVASTSARPERADIVAKLLHGPADAALDAHPVRRALRTGSPVILDTTGADIAPTLSSDPEQTAVLRAIAPRSVMAIPLKARGRTLGVITFVSAESEHLYTTDDLTFAWSLADRAALAMDNAKLFRAREEMLSVVSHDLRNPLNVITVGLASLKRGVAEDRRAVFLDKIRRAADRMNRLIEDLLDVTRLETGSLSLEREAHPVAPIASDAFEMLRPLAEEKGVRLVNETGNLLPSIFADRDRILQILGNLLGNAIKFTPEGGTVAISARAARDGMVDLAVRDTGPGIAEIDQGRIFDRYFQAKRSDRKGGSGLGLAIAKGLVEAHGGRIWVESEPGAGATFHFEVPAATTSENEHSLPNAVAPSTEAR